ncbi:unnamed protein product [Arabis nemorensis]|uniref:USP domain-containing protein n=1 Tax=Arabis nemorensis TaxID=586526 RepID=A0A565CRZ2_9BRAS|nr:unnamed protein product [Arabis nemorensis]
MYASQTLFACTIVCQFCLANQTNEDSQLLGPAWYTHFLVIASVVRKALLRFTAVELLDDGAKVYQCERCKQKIKAKKQLTVSIVPYVLTVHLKRFEAHRSKKIDRKVEFASAVDMKPFVSLPIEVASGSACLHVEDDNSVSVHCKSIASSNGSMLLGSPTGELKERTNRNGAILASDQEPPLRS